MRQVPSYLLIGNGRVARHFQHYFSMLNLVYTQWHRQQPLSELRQGIEQATHILILVSDGVIEDFIDEYLSASRAVLIHFSGSLVTEKAYGAHPLMTFAHELYDRAQYQAIPFILDHDAPAFCELLPGLPNQSVRLHKSLKPRYHALCVLSGNFSCLLWQKLFQTFEQELQIPASAAHPYLLQQTQNLLSHFPTALTGPLARGDAATLKKNLSALENDPYQRVYQSFMDCYADLVQENKHEHF
ncbi:hypothetical protein AQUSIP_17600 [Aquicella siphonis]|uniref:DUF2520 domain-containing protein n=1 Tax=Aquicella siphonis TaxID=254247 RepID=A0A5E4PJ32_9COXI|nr:DUF2520 domain-containing protein [Aquicella siphonis]VVC76447.1 hypothetical protein AQUSIP_17600 [Aquicella siphonis]